MKLATNAIQVVNRDVSAAFPELPARYTEALVAILALERIYQHGVAGSPGTFPGAVLHALETRHLTVSRRLGARRYYWLTVAGVQLARAEEDRRKTWERAS